MFTPGATLPSAVQNVTLEKIEFPVITNTPYPKMVLTDMIGPSQFPVIDGLRSDVKGHSVQLKFIMTGLLQGIHAHITCMRMCPPLTNKNWNVYEPRLALGELFESQSFFLCISIH